MYIGDELPVERFEFSRQANMVGEGLLFHGRRIGRLSAKISDGALMIGWRPPEQKRVVPSVSGAALRQETIWRRATHIFISFIGGCLTIVLAIVTLIKLACFLFFLETLNLIAFLCASPIFEAETTFGTLAHFGDILLDVLQ